MLKSKGYWARGDRAGRPRQGYASVLEAFLMAMQPVVRGVEVEDDLLERPLVRLQEEVDEQGLIHTSGRSGSRGFW
jgi:hypothetical protein